MEARNASGFSAVSLVGEVIGSLVGEVIGNW